MNTPKSISILHVVDSIRILSGVSSFLMNIYRNIDRNKFKFSFLVCKRDQLSYEKEILSLGGSVFYISNPLNIKTHFTAINDSKNFFKNHAGYFDIIELHSPNLLEFTVKYAKRNGAKICIAHSHSTVSSDSFFKRIINFFLTYRVDTLCNVFFSCSAGAARFLFGKKIYKQNQYTIINNAIDTSIYFFNSDKRISFRKELGIQRKKVVIHVSNFNPIKNTLFLYNVIQHVSEKDRNILFIFLGDGPDKNKLEKKLKKKDLLQFCLFERPTMDISKYLQCSDLFVLPSKKEGLGLVLVEAQASGLHCIASDTIVNEAAVNNVEFIPLLTKKWAEAILGFKPLSLSQRNMLSKDFSTSKFDIRTESKRLMNLYWELCKINL